jgi:hypothetical protein
VNKLAREDMGRDKQEKVAALGRGLRQGIPVENSDRDSSMDDVMDKLGRID